jgi:putative flippase GtrA
MIDQNPHHRVDRSGRRVQWAALLRFLASGIPGFLAAIATNVLFTDYLHWWKPLSYIVALWVQMTTNFFVCRRLVFSCDIESPWPRQYRGFMAGNVCIRSVEWIVYTTAVSAFDVPYVAAQLANIVLFSLVKFRFAQSIFSRKEIKASQIESSTETAR